MNEENSMFGQSEGGNIVFASVIDGKFAQKVDQSVATNEDGSLKPNYRKRVNKNGDTVYEYTFASAFGRITQLNFREGKFGDELQLGLRNDEANTTLVLGVMLLNEKSQTMNMVPASIADQIGLIDFSKDVKIGLSRKEGKVKGVAFTQDDVYIPNFNENQAFHDHVSQRPAAVEKPALGGKGTVWDFKEQSEWQYNQLAKNIERLVTFLNEPTKAVNNSGSISSPTNEGVAEESGDGADADGIPF